MDIQRKSPNIKLEIDENELKKYIDLVFRETQKHTKK